MRVSCGVLAGGESRRMGRDKALVDFDGRPLAVHVVDRLSAWADDVFVIGKQIEPFGALGLRAYRDAQDVRTPLAGVLTALRVAAHPLVFVCATDMPHVSGDVVTFLASRAEDADAVVPMRAGRLEPLHAVWSSSAARVVADALTAGDRAVHRVLRRLNAVIVDEQEWRIVDPDGTSFTNVNTPDELRAASVGWPVAAPHDPREVVQCDTSGDGVPERVAQERRVDPLTRVMRGDPRKIEENAPDVVRQS